LAFAVIFSDIAEILHHSLPWNLKLMYEHSAWKELD
jgi:hypothetical protein